MPNITALPGSALQLIQQLAASRRISGANKYARVSRAWRAASHVWDWEPLRLWLDLDGLEQQQLQHAIRWYTKHGHQMHHLVIQCLKGPCFRVLEQLWFAAVNCHNLTRLEVVGEEENTLVQLAPLLTQLPKLQHLKASITVMSRTDSDNAPGVFCTANFQQPLQEPVPVLQELCPQLCGLHLVIGSCSNYMDPRLQQLLPCSLEQLHLEVQMVPLVLDPAHLAGCTALQQLTVNNMELVDGQALAALSSIKTMRMVDVAGADEELLPLKGKLVQYLAHTRLYWDDTQALSQLTALTALTIHHSVNLALREYCLTPLTALRQLELLSLRDAHTSQLPELLQQLAGLPQLRDLRLSGRCLCQEVAGVGALRQLTGLYISGLVHPDLAAHVGPQGELADPWFALLQQLPGLQRLEVDAELIVDANQPWWTSLTALTQLIAVMRGVVVRDECMAYVQFTLAPAHPMHLKQLVFKVILGIEEWEEEGPRWCSRPCMLPGVTAAIWQQLPDMFQYQVPPPCTPCPWLPGVWEVAEAPE